MNKNILFALSHLWLLLPIIAWTLLWKGLALWKAARGGQYAWFIIFLVVNTLGILEIIYILLFAPKKENKDAEKLPDSQSVSKKIV